MTVLTWLGCDLVTGRIVEELPGISSQGTIGKLLGTYTSTSLILPIPRAGHGAPPKRWEGATEPARTMIVAVLGGQPVWAGIVLTRVGGSAPGVTLGCVSLEGYLDRRYVGDIDFFQVDEVLIAASLFDEANIEGIGLWVDAPETGEPREREYKDQDDKTIYSALRELMGVENGPEWTIDVEWADASQTAVRKIARVRKRIGFAAGTPNAVFSTGGANAVVSSQGGSAATYELTEDYTSGKGGNHIVATSSGEGETRPQSDPARDENLLNIGMPRYEHRWSPSSSISNKATLDDHARQSLALLARGAKVLTITARADTYPMLGTDWAAGDDVGYDLRGPRHPQGLTGVARSVGWDLDPAAATVTPILLTPGEEVISE